jgi:hypothetical protein
MITSRRSFLRGLVAAIAAPAIVRAEILMPVKSLWVPWGEIDVTDALRPDLVRQDAGLMAEVEAYARAHKLQIANAAGDITFETTLYREDEYVSDLWVRRATVKLLTDGKATYKPVEER